HPHAVRILDVDTIPDDGLPFLVMEFLEGNDLGGVIAAEGPMDPERATRYVIQGASAAGGGHALGVITRDAKPQTLFLTTRDPVKVLDFGLAKNLNLATSTTQQTKTNATLGSPYYMSPEQLRSSRDVDPRTDIWALGATLFYLIVGQPPFSAPNAYRL